LYQATHIRLFEDLDKILQNVSSSVLQNLRDQNSIEK